ncbi:MAG: transposase [Spartobacteria bacterium]|nr:transposase [Spartobacteria bacterium]
MRRKRIKREQLSYYHCMTRVVGRQMLLGNVEKRHMQQLIRKVEGFTGVRVLTYALMTNHIHLLLEEPDRCTEVSDEELLLRMRSLYSDEEMEEIEARWREWGAQGNIEAVDYDKYLYRRRMHDISEFMKTLKHRFSFWYNRRNDRKGTLWSERFKSVLVEGGDVLRTVAAYIEMNPVRAGLAADPSEYPFCGFGDAVTGSERAREGVIELMVQKGRAFGCDIARKWETQSGRYIEEVLLYGDMDGEGCVKTAEKLLQRCRSFTAGQVLGSKDFVEAFFRDNRDYFGPRRREGRCKLRGDWKGIFAVRDVGKDYRKVNPDGIP